MNTKNAVPIVISPFVVGAIVALVPVIGSASLASAQAPSREPAAEAAFMKENDVAMTKMMNEMTGKPTDDVDQDFAAIMIPHHQGAIDMAKAELRFGRNEQLLRVAQETVVEQLQEIAAMRAALGEQLTLAEARLAAASTSITTELGAPPSASAANIPLQVR